MRPAETRLVTAHGKRHAWRLLAIWGLLLVAYSNSFQGGLFLDNAAIIGQDPRIRHVTAHNVLSILEGGYRYNNPDVGLYRPLTTLTYMVTYTAFGNESRPVGYHAVNLALHCVNVSLVYPWESLCSPMPRLRRVLVSPGPLDGEGCIPGHGEFLKSCGDWSLIQPTTMSAPPVGFEIDR